MSIAHTQQAQAARPTLEQGEVPYLPCIRCPNGACINLAFVAEWARMDGDLVLVMAYPSPVAPGPTTLRFGPGPFADWVEGLLDVVTLDGPDS
jgi:hypothetical protein